MRKIICILLSGLVLMALFMLPCAAETALYKDTVFTVSGFGTPSSISDIKRTTFTEAKEEATVTLKRNEGIAHIYIEFDRIPNGWTLLAENEEIPLGKEKFLHDYLDVEELLGTAPSEITLKFPQGTWIADIYGFSKGELPNFVQIWDKPCEKADLLLISSHSDDEQLFFAGILPYYAIERKLNVQVAYIVQHFEANGVKDHTRPHEQLDGLWTVGIRNYPVMSDFPDLYSKSTDREIAFKSAEKVFGAAGVTYDDFKGYITENLRRFKPLVVVSHDLSGEYGHGTHVFCAKALTKSINLAPDSTHFPESAEKYGVWQVEKTYLHLYEQNKITMDWDTPLESLGGKTPFQMTQEGFGCHKSQHWTWFNRWIYGQNKEITKASQIKTYSPCEFGLFDTKVGLDTVGGDFMENIITYKEREEAEAKKLEAIKKAEEKEKEKEELANQKATEKSKQTPLTITLLIAAVVVIVLILRIAYVQHIKRKKRDKIRGKHI